MSRQGMVTKTFTFEGKRYYVYGETETEAIEKRFKKKQELIEGRTILNSSITVREWALKAIKVYKTNQKEITRKKYIQRIESCILKHIGDRSLKSIKTIQLQELVNIQAGKSKTQVNEVYNAIKFIFQSAYENKLLPNNPAEFLKKPSSYSSKRRAITDYERLHFLKVLDMDKRFLVFALMLFCGCRPSEARAARRNHFQQENGQWLFSVPGTKTDQAVRTVPVPQAMVDFIGDFLKKRNFEPLAKTSDGNALTIQTFNRAWKRLKREVNISMGAKLYRNQLKEPLPLAPDFVPYCLRHTYCTDLLKSGVDIRTAQYLMGHSTIEMTANIYTHIDKNIIVKEAQKIIK